LSGREVNQLIGGLCGECLPSIDLAHADLPGCEQRPEQHCSRFCRWQHGLCLDPSFELFVQLLDCVRRSRASPLTWWQPREGEQAVSGFFQAVGDRTMAKPPFANKGLAAFLISSGVAAYIMSV